MSEHTKLSQSERRYSADDFGPSHRWVVFVCAADGHPMEVGYTEDEYAVPCNACGAPLVPVVVRPLEAPDA